MIAHARWPSGSQSRASGGSRKTWSESDRMKLYPIPVIFSCINKPHDSTRFHPPTLQDTTHSYATPSNRTGGHDCDDSGEHDVGDPGSGRRYDRDLRRQFTVVRPFVSPFIPHLGCGSTRAGQPAMCLVSLDTWVLTRSWCAPPRP